uniref:Uncharacterized protein n=1 Tax=Chromera velia CCMP2878 TaxID=1169474 RepID=A0A0G4GTL6_9ALVE|eukprot:Cvel_23339.t1-p1 / transcript=Cvel_23339.t1 / gene=Cvel_23339 / organism=Chromera_velia_CCMP2878 / gene_product=hypothetical protein / transcript_product=hypothetical protein / location=Cvel_scaffold2392:7226-16090(+) / protein_length=285 / sequence_SO=supercontig / SO=protein_coding / is_pseudo=false
MAGDGSPVQGPTEGSVGEITEDPQAKEECLSLFLSRMRMTSETLSCLARQRESFGLAWFGVFLLNQNKALGKNLVAPPRSIDLSGIRGLSSKKIFLFLNSLPPSVEEMKLDSVAVKGPALRLFLSFLRRVQAAREEEVEDADDSDEGSLQLSDSSSSSSGTEGKGGLSWQAPRLKSFTFAGNPLVPCVSGPCPFFRLPHNEIRALVNVVRYGKALSLYVLDLERTGLKSSARWGVQELCDAVKGKSLKVETLNLLGNNIGGVEEMERLSAVLCQDSLPCVRELLL